MLMVMVMEMVIIMMIHSCYSVVSQLLRIPICFVFMAKRKKRCLTEVCIMAIFDWQVCILSSHHPPRLIPGPIFFHEFVPMYAEKIVFAQKHKMEISLLCKYRK